MEKRQSSCIITLLVLVASAFVLIAVHDGSDATFENSEEYRAAISTNIPIMILSEDSELMSQKLSFGTNRISICSSIPVITEEKAVLIDDSWVKKNNKWKVNQFVVDAINNGIIVTSIGSSELFYNNPNLEFIAFMEDCDTYSVYKSPDGSKYICHSIDDGNSESSLAKTYCWINKHLKEKEANQDTMDVILPWGAEYSSFNTIQMISDLSRYMVVTNV